MALDTISVSRAFEDDEDELRRANRVAHSIEQALKGEIRIAEAVAAKHGRKHSKAFHVVAEVVIDNALSNRYTVVEVSGLDRPGLLYELTTALGRLNLNIASAHIATFGEKVVDVFYVTDLTGSKIMHTSRNKAIETTLHAILNPAGESKKSPTAS
jgi:[protein-PII] uridylyltransferase